MPTDPTEHRPAGQESLEQRLAAWQIREEDLEESFVRSGGHGGQHVNKTSTCVVLRHLPTGIQVKCQASRHQGQNRRLARELLIQKLQAIRRAGERARRMEVEKVRRQKRGRTAAAKRRMLEEKSRRSRQKALRRKPQPEGG